MFKVEIRYADAKKWYNNDLTFNTKKKAKKYAIDEMLKWSGPIDYRIIEA